MSLSPAPSAATAGSLPWVERLAWASLCLFVFTMPWEKAVQFAGLGSIARTAGIAAFLLGAVALWRRRAVRSPNLVLLLSALFIVWSATTWLWSLDRPATLARTVTYAQLWALLWLLWEFCRSATRSRQLLAVYLAGAVVGAGITFVRYGLHLQTYYRRYAATGFDPNDFGLLLALSLPMALYLGLTSSGWRRAAVYVGAALAIAALLLTASRTALLAALLAFMLIPFTWSAASRWSRAASLALLAFLLLSLLEFAPAPARGRLATIPQEVTRGSINSRKQIWKAGVRVWLYRPILGAGAGAYPDAVRPILGEPQLAGAQYVAHNTHLSVLVETGLAGFALWAALLGVLAVFVWLMPSPERALFAVLLAVWALGVTTLTWEHYKGTWLVFGLITAAWPRSFQPPYSRGKEPAP